MLAARELPDFKTPQERDAYIKEHAEHCTVSYRSKNIRIKIELEHLDVARLIASALATLINRNLMIYAVYGPYDALIETAKPQKPEK